MTDKDGNLLWFGNYTDWGHLKEETRVTDSAYQPFRLHKQYADRETGLHYNFFRHYETDAGPLVNQDPIGLVGGDNLYSFANNATSWTDCLGVLPEFSIAGYKDSRHKNDKLSANELLQNAWLRQNNKVPSRNSGIAKCNPAMALHEQDVHKHISRLQRNANLFDPKN